MFFPCAPQDDGAIRVWKNFADLEKNPEMVTAWQGLSDMLPTTRGGSQGLSGGSLKISLAAAWQEEPVTSFSPSSSFGSCSSLFIVGQEVAEGCVL